MKIDRLFIFFKTRSAFEEALNADSIKHDSIVFIADDHVLWTHGIMFGGAGSYLEEYATKEYVDEIINNLNINIEVDSKLDSTSENPVLNKVITEELARLEAMLSVLEQFKVKVVDSLDEVTNPDSHTIYLVKSPDDDTLYTQWLWVDGEWINLGSLSSILDLANYYTKEEINNIIEGLKLDTDSKFEDLEDKVDNILDDLDLSDYVRREEVYTPDLTDFGSSTDQVDKPNSSQGGAVDSDKLWTRIVAFIKDLVEISIPEITVDKKVKKDSENPVSGGAVYEALEKKISFDAFRQLIDDRLSDTSENPVLNKVITKALAELKEIQNLFGDDLRDSLILYLSQELYNNVYNKDEVNELITKIQSFKVKVVDSLDEVTEPDSYTIYLVKDENGDSLYTLYIYSEGQWIKLGSQSSILDLTDYYNKEEIDVKLQEISLVLNINLENYYTKLEVNSKFNDYYDKDQIDQQLIDLENKLSENKSTAEDQLSEAVSDIEEQLSEINNKFGDYVEKDDVYTPDEDLTFSTDQIDQANSFHGSTVVDDNLWSRIVDFINWKLANISQGDGGEIDIEELRESLINYINTEYYTKSEIDASNEDLWNRIVEYVTEQISKIGTGGNPNIPTDPNNPDCNCDFTYQPKNIILEEEEYNALTEYEDNAIYFVLEPEKPEGWRFGEAFPIILN